MTPERKLAILHNEIFANIARIGSPLLVQETLKVVSDKLKIPVSAAMAEYSLFLRKNFRSRARSFTKDTPSPDYKNIRQKNYPMPTRIKTDDASGVTDGSNQILTREETLAGILLFYPEYAVRFSEDMFCDHKCCFVWKKMLEVYNLRKTAPSGKQPDNNNNVMELFPEDMLGWISSVTLRCPYGSKSADKTALIDEIVDKIYREMEEAMVRKRLDVLKEELQVMLLKGEVDKSKNDEYISLLRRLKVPPSAGSPPSSPSSGTYPKV